MSWLLGGVLLLLAGAALSLLLSRRPRAGRTAFLAALTGGCLAGLIPTLGVLGRGQVESVTFPWSVPMGSLALGVDPLSAFFLLLIFVVCLAAGVYGEAYLAASRVPLPRAGIRFFYLVLTAAMALLVCARNAVFFLASWEVMALSGFFLICAEHGKEEVRRAGLLYLICTHLGTLCLFLLFAWIGARAGSMDFSAWRPALAAEFPPTALLALAVAGFGMKAGFMPLHVWLQEAHPAAPSPVSAVLSGVMIKMGIYGLLRLISMLPMVPESWGYAFLGLGVSSGILGVLFALAQHDLKRLLAYHSIENIGIISLGLGLGCLGLSGGRPGLAVLGFSGGILHVLNHGLFKSLLFLGAGAYYQALGTREIEGAGGLLRRMPKTSLFSWIGAAAICGLPPLNGFISEWLVYAGFLGGNLGRKGGFVVFGAAALALIGGLAAACFTKAYGALCLGEPRSEAAARARDPEGLMLWPMAALAGLCVLIGLWPLPAVRAAGLASSVVCGLPPAQALGAIEGVSSALAMIGMLGCLLCAASAGLWAWRSARLKAEASAEGSTWGCGFTRPTPRMQYTASSYAQPLLGVFSGLVPVHVRHSPPSGYWPKKAHFHSHTPDAALDEAILPAASAAGQALSPLRRLQHGMLQFYLLYVSIFLIALLLWKL